MAILGDAKNGNLQRKLIIAIFTANFICLCLLRLSLNFQGGLLYMRLYYICVLSYIERSILNPSTKLRLVPLPLTSEATH